MASTRRPPAGGTHGASKRLIRVCRRRSGALQVLERNSLVWKVGENHTPEGGGIEPEYEITSYGDYS